MKRILTLCCMMLSICVVMKVYAVPAKPGIQTIEQTDGTTLRIMVHGDEHFHFTTTEDGYLIRQNAAGVYEYAEYTAEKVIKPMGLKAYSKDQRATAMQKLPSRAVLAEEAFRGTDAGQKVREEKLGTDEKGRLQLAHSKKAASTTGLAARGLVLLVQYSDVKLNSASTKIAMSEMLNGSSYSYDGATGSVKNYFSDQSNGAYVPTFDVFGPITLSQTMAYYGQNDSDGNDLRPAQMVNEACSIANAKFGVDFTQYDSDSDGNVDFVYVIYAGYAEAQGGSENTIWPHRWNLSAAGVSASSRKYDGKYVLSYACSSELRGASGSTRDGIGTFCHEFSHVLGLPDYYDTQYGTNYKNSATPGAWSLMDGGSYNNDGKTPPNYSAYDKYFLGWIQPSVLNAACNVTLSADGETYYAITSDGTLSSAVVSKDVWYLENRQQTGWDAYVPAHGMLVTRVRYNQTSWTNNTVNNGTTMFYDIIEADGKGSGYSTAGVTFPGMNNVLSFTPVGNYSLSNITETSGVISFNFMGGDGDDNGEETTDEVVFYDSFETTGDWIMTDPSSTCQYAEYGGIFMGSFSDLPAVGDSYYLISSYDASAARNAWAIMRNGVTLKVGEYTLSAYVYAPGYGGVNDRIQFTVGTSNAISSQTQVMIDVYKAYSSWTLVSVPFRVTAGGVFYFGIHHCTSVADVNAIAVDDFAITRAADVTTALEDISIQEAESDVRKVLENGTLYIIRNNEKYTVGGLRVM